MIRPHLARSIFELARLVTRNEPLRLVSITRELGSRNITANVVAPGFIDTEMTDVLPEARRAEILTAIPAGRLAHPDEVAAAVTWLASDASAYVSGAVIPVDGGLGMGH